MAGCDLPDRFAVSRLKWTILCSKAARLLHVQTAYHPAHNQEKPNTHPLFLPSCLHLASIGKMLGGMKSDLLIIDPVAINASGGG